METLGDKLKQLRNELTQEELAAILRVDRSTLASWEINRREPDIATLCRIASHFEVSIDWLVGYSSDSSSPSKASRFLEGSNQYVTDVDNGWHDVIKIAQQYGFDPEMVCNLLKINIKVALSLKDCKQERSPQ